MIGPRIGISTGERFGIAAGVSADPIAGGGGAAPVAPSIGATMSRQRIIAPPATGTFSTLATLPGWAQSTAYNIVDTPNVGTRLVNGGNLYQCAVSGTSAGSGSGPAGTGPTVADNTVTWQYLGAGTAPMNTSSGSRFAAVVARGLWAAAPTGPTDNKSNTWSIVGSARSYAGFPQSAVAAYQTDTTLGGAGHVFSAAFGQFGGVDEGDEVTLCVLEIKGVGACNVNSYVERANATGGLVTTQGITVTVPSILIQFWCGNGNIVSPGTMHTATPQGALQLLPGASSLMGLPGSGYIQIAAGWRQVTAGTYTDQWGTNGEGAVLLSLAFPVL